ncbi:MAG TPA: hypothetical protein VHF27_00375 [Acidimicrobiales bacterium]|nr:hypothetical protein [Acidimicrobiales bacterium]
MALHIAVSGGQRPGSTSREEQLTRIEVPGGVLTDFGYSAASGGRLDSVRSPLANDAVAPAPTGVTGRVNDASMQTVC